MNIIFHVEFIQSLPCDNGEDFVRQTVDVAEREIVGDDILES